MILLAALLACGDGGADPTDAGADTDAAVTDTAATTTGCPPDSPFGWDDFGAPFFLTWCTGCHSVGRVGEERSGAPDGVNFDSLDEVRAWSSRIAVRAVDAGDMPPQYGPDDVARARLAEWLACGAPE